MTDLTHHPDMDNAYGGLVEAESDARWAFGTGFDDPLTGVDAAVPDGVDAEALAAYCLMLGDDSLVLAQRLVEWCTHAPELEEEVALANIALDLLGQTRLLFARAAAAHPDGVPLMPEGSPVPAEDRLAFFRDTEQLRCVWLVELPNGDFATTVVRLAAFASWRLALLEGLVGSTDPVLAAVAAKAAKEVRYHRDYAARWMLTLAGGTEESRHRTDAALTAVWPCLPELARQDEVTTRLSEVGVAPDPAAVWAEAAAYLDRLLSAAELGPPEVEPAPGPERSGGRAGAHTPWLEPLREELQGLARAHPMGRW